MIIKFEEIVFPQVWRTYLVANEWNELQTTRKINLSLQIILVILVLRVILSKYNRKLGYLSTGRWFYAKNNKMDNKHFIHLTKKVFGMEHLANADPLNSFTINDGQYHSDPSYVCRFALGVAVYAGISLLQVSLFFIFMMLKDCICSLFWSIIMFPGSILVWHLHRSYWR